MTKQQNNRGLLREISLHTDTILLIMCMTPRPTLLSSQYAILYIQVSMVVHTHTTCTDFLYTNLVRARLE